MNYEFSFSRLVRIIRRLGVSGFVLSVYNHFLGAYVARRFSSLTRKAISGFVSRNAKNHVLVMISTLDWGFPFAQRTHHLAKALAKKGYMVIFVSPSNGYDHFLFSLRPSENILVTKDVGATFGLLHHPTVYIASADGRFDGDFFERVKINGGRIVYDYLDDLDDKVSNVPITDGRRRLHGVLLSDQENCLVVATASRLLDDVRAVRRSNYALITNGVDVDHYDVRRERGEIRSDFSTILDRKRPIVGYFGALASWVDYDLLLKMANELRDVEIVLIGPDYDGSRGQLRGGPSNLHILDAIGYSDLPRHAVWFDIAIIPFLLNDITDATSPLKLFEYMALGLPIVSTNIAEARKYQSVRVGKSSQEFISLVARIVEGGISDFERACIKREAEANSWSAKAGALLELMDPRS